MASREGERPVGSDGFDFSHRQQIASQYRISAKTKFRLKFCIFMHFLLALLMFAKLFQDVLDRLDIFILEIEELHIPKPARWEWLWQSSVVFCFSGLTAIRRNRIGSLQFFVFGEFVFGLCTAFYALGCNFGEFWTYVNEQSTEGLIVWQGYPVGVIWYIFLMLALQVHLFSLFFAKELYFAWSVKGTKVQ